MTKNLISRREYKNKQLKKINGREDNCLKNKMTIIILFDGLPKKFEYDWIKN